MYDPVDYEWMFKVLSGRYRGAEGTHIVRIAEQLSEMERLIHRASELGVRNPEGVCGWLGKKRRGIKANGRSLANREMYIYFKDCSIVKSHKLSGVIGRNCISLDFAGDLEEPDGDVFQV